MRKPAPQPRLRLDDLPTRELIARGAALRAAQDYKDAIDVYKLLLKREPQSASGWREALATAYLERARQLAQKGMYREAAVLWENLPTLCGQTPQPEQYLDWLLRSGQYAKAMRAYQEYAARLTSADGVETLLAALALAGQKDVLQALPADAPLRTHLAAAQAALRAYSQGEAEEVVRERLKVLSIRSPYRDLRQTLAALLKLETDPAGALTLIERMPATSPYQDLVELVRTGAARDPARALLALDPALHEPASGLLGLDAPQLKLLKDWARLNDSPSDKAKFEFITAHLALFDREQARRGGLALLLAYPQGLKLYNQRFGPLSPFETQRLQALRAERAEQLADALRAWQACANHALQDTSDPDHSLTAALILRHMAELLEKEDSGWDDGQRLRDCLEQSLRFDPDDRDVYLRLAGLHQEVGNDKDYHHWVEQAVKHFPDDPAALLAAVKTATARKAHKKAASFAARVLELDPINSKARAVLINAHLAHARKQMRAEKYALAEKELNSASQLERDKTRTGVIEINRGLLALQQRQYDRGRQWLREGVRLAGSPVLGWLRLAVEALRLKREPADFQRDAELGDPRKLSINRADLLVLARAINAYHEEEDLKDLGTVLEDLEQPLRRAIKTLTSEDDLLLVCECLHQAPHYDLLEYAATRALELQPHRALFIYYQVYGRAKGKPYQMKGRDDDRLEDALKRAAATRDHRSAVLIERFLMDGGFPFRLPRGRPRSGPAIPQSLPMPPKMRREMEEIHRELERLPPVLREQMLNQILDDLPPDEDVPPEIQRALMKAMLLGGGSIEKLIDELPDFPLPPQGRGRGRRGT